ncbi:hypothetical protein [Vibrio sp. HN007]|uniref:hypothetical protein n=1 Tax=Vibrio iocasae TaxID=3098914 RepID=UPI0035D40C2F
MERLKRIPWSESLEQKLGDQFDNIPALKASVKRGAEIYEIDQELTIIIRPEPLADGSGWEIVWLISFGRNLNKHIPFILGRIKEKNFKSVRYHCDETERAVVRLVQRHGAEPVETVYRFELERFNPDGQ